MLLRSCRWKLLAFSGGQSNDFATKPRHRQGHDPPPTGPRSRQAMAKLKSIPQVSAVTTPSRAARAPSGQIALGQVQWSAPATA